MSEFRFLHAADVHLDSPLHGLSRYDGIPLEDVRGATRAAFDNLVNQALAEDVDFVIIAGDLFDGDWKDMGTGLYFARAMGRLDQAAIPVFLLAGNHDAASVLSRTIPWPDTSGPLRPGSPKHIYSKASASPSTARVSPMQRWSPISLPLIRWRFLISST